MATRIIEYGGRGRADGYPTVPAKQKVTAQTPFTATTTSTQSAAFNSATSVVCVQSDEAVYVSESSNNPTATTGDYRIQAGQEQFFDVAPGDKIAVRT